jgi:hypothetical protein
MTVPTQINPIIDKYLTDWISAQVAIFPECSVIWANQTAYGNQKGIRPKKPYVMLNPIVRAMQKGTVDMDGDNLPVDEFEYSWTNNFTLSINIYSQDDPMGIADRIKSSLNLPTIHQERRSVGLGLVNYEPIKDLSEVVNDKMELRAQFDVLFNYIDKRNDAPGEVQKVGIGADYDDGRITEQIVIDKGE